MRSLLACPLLLTLALAGCTASASPSAVVVQTPTPSTSSAGTFTLARGADTIGVERFTRTAERLQAEFTRRGQRVFGYTATLTPDAGVSRFEATMMPGPNAPAGTLPMSAIAVLARDSVDVSMGRGDVLENAPRRATPAGTVVYVNPSPSLMEQMVRRARRIAGPGGTTASVPIFTAGGATPSQQVAVTFIGADSARVDVGAVQLRFRVDQDGAILGGQVPAQGLTITRSTP